MGAIYSLGFYILASLAMTLGGGFGGWVEWLWVAVALAWLALAVRYIIKPETRWTGYGMVGSVVIIFGVFWALGSLLSLVVVP